MGETRVQRRLSLVPRGRDKWSPASSALTREMAAWFLWIPRSTRSSGRSAERPHP